MRVIIAGGRDYQLTGNDWRVLDLLRRLLQPTIIVCGMARGADLGGKEWAESRGIPVKPYYADWDNYPGRAGYIRNVRMARNADALIAFPGGNGTCHMLDVAEEYGLRIFTPRGDPRTYTR